jgi:hypothetical protein
VIDFRELVRGVLAETDAIELHASDLDHPGDDGGWGIA